MQHFTSVFSANLLRFQIREQQGGLEHWPALFPGGAVQLEYGHDDELPTRLILHLDIALEVRCANERIIAPWHWQNARRSRAALAADCGGLCAAFAAEGSPAPLNAPGGVRFRRPDSLSLDALALARKHVRNISTSFPM